MRLMQASSVSLSFCREPRLNRPCQKMEVVPTTVGDLLDDCKSQTIASLFHFEYDDLRLG